MLMRTSSISPLSFVLRVGHFTCNELLSFTGNVVITQLKFYLYFVLFVCMLGKFTAAERPPSLKKSQIFPTIVNQTTHATSKETNLYTISQCPDCEYSKNRQCHRKSSQPTWSHFLCSTLHPLIFSDCWNLQDTHMIRNR